MEAVVVQDERRRSRRACDIAEHGILCARIRPGHTAALVDVSPDGALIETAHRLLPGTSVVLHFESSDRRESIRGRVLRSVVAGLHGHGIAYRGAIGFESPLTCLGPGHVSEQRLPADCARVLHQRESATRSGSQPTPEANVNVERI
jgi:hypothetical protein